jgi:hypothetical protein
MAIPSQLISIYFLLSSTLSPAIKLEYWKASSNEIQTTVVWRLRKEGKFRDLIILVYA